MSYATLEQLKDYLRTSTSDLDDVELQRSLDSASREIDQLCSRSFAPADGILPHFDVPHWDRRGGAWVAEIPDLFDLTGLAVYGWDAAAKTFTVAVDLGTDPDLSLRPLGATDFGRPWTQLVMPAGSYSQSFYPAAMESTVAILGAFGWVSIPEPVVEATLIQAARIHRRRDALFGVVNSPDGSSQMRLKAAMDPDVLVLLDGLIKRWGSR